MPSYTRFPRRAAATFQGLGIGPSTDMFKKLSVVGTMRSGISDTVGSGRVQERARTLPTLPTTMEIASSVPDYVREDPRFKTALTAFDTANKELIALRVMSTKPIKGRALAPSDLPYPVLGSVDPMEVARFVAVFAKQESGVERLTAFAASPQENANGRLAAWIILRLPMFQAWPWRRAITNEPSLFDASVGGNVLNNKATDPAYLSSLAMQEASSGTGDEAISGSIGRVTAFAALWAKRYGIDAQKKVLDNRAAAVRAAEKAMKSAADVVIAERAAVESATKASQEKADKAAAEAQAKLDEAAVKQAELEAKLTKLEENKSTAEETIEAGGFVLSKGVVLGGAAILAIGGFMLYRKFKR
jgi:hypothetical protein